ncbi:hypothetical protein AVEN_45394-1 [Araneus ventricosus]|uniref:Uncharacterized protein n=1 Tax=Araneus ventricosus TaxID=182803 RepID=A0A4Y2P2A0_ARAVE|nr:hypothetical protein AVEN_45394-1 [Araneus ventricosus]
MEVFAANQVIHLQKSCLEWNVCDITQFLGLLIRIFDVSIVRDYFSALSVVFSGDRINLPRLFFPSDLFLEAVSSAESDKGNGVVMASVERNNGYCKRKIRRKIYWVVCVAFADL